MSNIAVKRIHCDVRELNRNPSRQYSAAPLEDNLFEWHFTLRGPQGSDFQGGLYHGRILLPPQWPMKPPSIMFLNASGRFEVGKKVCLSATSFHPEHWQPAWGIRTILEALVAFFPTPADGALGALQWRPDERRKLALESQTWRCPCCGPIAELVEGGADERVLADGEAASAAFDAPVLPWDEGRAAAPAAAPAPAAAAPAAAPAATDAVQEVVPPTPDPEPAAPAAEEPKSEPSAREAPEPAPAPAEETTSEPAAAEEAKAPEPAVAPTDESLKVHVDLNGVQVYFKIKRTTRMQKVFSALATRQGVDVTSLRVTFRGARVGGLDTADIVGLRDGDRLDAEVIEPEPAPAPPVAPPPVRDAAPAAPVPADLLIVDSLIAVVSVALVAVVAHKYLAA